MNTKSPECWASDPQARALHIEISTERSLLLPFDQFLLAELTNDGKEQRLRLVFATHEVLLRGHALRRIETAMQRMELSSVCALNEHYRSAVPGGQPTISEVVIKECDRPERDDKVPNGERLDNCSGAGKLVAT